MGYKSTNHHIQPNCVTVVRNLNLTYYKSFNYLLYSVVIFYNKQHTLIGCSIMNTFLVIFLAKNILVVVLYPVI